MNKVFGICIALCSILLSVLTIYASDRILEDALNEKKAVDELSGRLKNIKKLQQNSSVFSEKEITASGEKIKILEDTSQKELKEVIQQLSGIAGKSDSGQKKLYKNASESYSEAINKIAGIYEMSEDDLKEKMELYQALSMQKSLLENLSETKNNLEGNKNNIDENDVDQLAEMAEEQNALSEKVEDRNISDKMKNAAESLGNLDLENAVSQQKEIVSELENHVDDMLKAQSQEFEDSSMMEQMDMMDDELSQMQSQISNAMKSEQSELSTEQRRKMALEMSRMNQELSKQSMNGEMSEELDQAMQNVLQAKDEETLRNLRNAQRQLKARKQQLAQKMQEQQKAQMQASMNAEEAMSDDQEKPDSIEYGKRSSVSGDDWTAKLPERERSALLSARKAEYNREFDEEVKEYFIKLAE